MLGEYGVGVSNATGGANFNSIGGSGVSPFGSSGYGWGNFMSLVAEIDATTIGIVLAAIAVVFYLVRRKN